MAFEAFLSETRARPRRASMIGFLASVAMHAPPATLFAVSWLTHAMLIGSSGHHAEDHPRRGSFVIPISIYGEGPGGGGDPSSTVSANRGNPARAGLPGRSGRSGRRGLVAPRDLKRPPKKVVWDDPFMLGSYAVAHGRGSFGQDDGGGDGRAGAGAGSGLTGHGNGSGGLIGGVGNGMIAAALTDRPKEKAEKKKTAGDAKERGSKHPADGVDDVPIGADLDVVLSDGRAMKAHYISQDSAAYYRTDEYYPRVHDAYWPPGRREWTMLFRICVSMEGAVSTVAVLKSANDEVDRLVGSALRSWRYRPRVVDGVARPFCHPIRIIYARPGASG